MHAAYLDRHPIQRDGRANLLIIAARIEYRIARDKRDLPGRRHTGGDRRHILFGDAHFDKTFRKFFLK